MNNFFFRLISRPTGGSPSPSIGPPRHLYDPSRDAAGLDGRRSLSIVGAAAIVLLVGANLGLEGCDQQGELSPPMEFGKDEARLFPEPVARCAQAVDGNAEASKLDRVCTEPRPEDPDFAAGPGR